MTDLAISTTRAIEALDITGLVLTEHWPEGFLWIGCPHTTAAVLVGESDPDMLADYERVAAELFASFEPFRHHKNGNPNAAAHLISSFIGAQLVLPVAGGRPTLGTHQRIVFLELDGPKPNRTVRLLSLPAGVEGSR